MSNIDCKDLSYIAEARVLQTSVDDVPMTLVLNIMLELWLKKPRCRSG